MTVQIESLRKELREIDQKLIDLLLSRNELVKQVQAYKLESQLPVYQANVQAKKLKQLEMQVQTSDAKLSEEEVDSLKLILSLIMDLSVSKQLNNWQLVDAVKQILDKFEARVTDELVAHANICKKAER